MRDTIRVSTFAVLLSLTGCGAFLTLEQAERDGQGRHILNVHEARKNTAQTLIYWHFLGLTDACSSEKANYCDLPRQSGPRQRYDIGRPIDDSLDGRRWSKQLRHSFHQMLKVGVSYHARLPLTKDRHIDADRVRLLWLGLQNKFVNCEVSGWSPLTGYVFAEFAQQNDHVYRKFKCHTASDDRGIFDFRVLAAKSGFDAEHFEIDINFYIDDSKTSGATTEVVSSITRELLSSDLSEWTEIRTENSSDDLKGYSFRRLHVFASSKRAGSNKWEKAVKVSLD